MGCELFYGYEAEVEQSYTALNRNFDINIGMSAKEASNMKFA
jgi:hypothetical protein